MRKPVICVLAALFWCALVDAKEVEAQEHEACFNLDYQYQMHTSKQLRAIAATCQSAPVSQLYYNRAYHVDLLHEGETLSQIVALISRDMRRHIEAYRLYIALIESFAPKWFADRDARAAFLNEEYDRRGEVAELRLHGYDRLADVKDKQNPIP